MMIRMFIISSLFWVAALLIYHFVLKRFTFHHLNRGYLLVSLLAGAILPFIPISSAEEAPLVVYLNPIVIQLNQVAAGITTQAQEASINYWSIIVMLYALIVVFYVLKLLQGVYSLWKQTRNASIKKKEGVYIVYSSDIKQPFSFWKWIFIQDEASLHPIILDHEYAHIKGGHSWDKLLLQLLAAIYWVIPVFPFYRKYINEVHEYIADDYVLQKTSKKKYSYFLLGQTGQGVTPLLSNNFHSLIKNRITMMLKKESNTYSRLWYLPVMVLMLGMASVILISCDNQKEEGIDAQIDEAPPASKLVSLIDTVITFDPATLKETVQIVKNDMEVFNKLDQMPLFSLDGCEDITDKEKQRDCSNHNMLQYIYNNIEYPEVKDKEGMVVIKFVVTKEGYIAHPEIVRTIGDSYSKAVLSMYNKLADHKWIPGVQNGENKNVFLHLPIKFKLD